MAIVTDAPSKHVTQICAKAGLRLCSQYRSPSSATTETIVKRTRMKQYWKTPIQTTYNHVNTTSPSPSQRLRPQYTHIEPRQSTPRLPERPLVFPTCTLLQPKHTPKPIHRLHRPEKDLLLMQVRRNIVTHKREETRNRKRLVAIP